MKKKQKKNNDMKFITGILLLLYIASLTTIYMFFSMLITIIGETWR
jgi:hypothetical protein